MLNIREVIVVEGRYDKNTLRQCVDAVVVETNGFGIFSDPEKMALLRRYAAERGLIIFTDSDGAGFVIRNRLKGCIDNRFLKHAYIPDVPGKERRKKTPGKEGLLGVEGMTPEVIRQALLRCGATAEDENADRRPITKADMAAAGLSGGPDASVRRAALQIELDLPARLTANGLLDALNVLLTREEFLELVKKSSI